MRDIALAVVLIIVSGLVEYFSWYAPLWAIGIPPIDFINGCRFAALALIVWGVVKAYRLKVPA